MAALRSSLWRKKISIELWLAALAIFGAAQMTASAQTAGAYTVTNLVSDGSVPATVTDANFINPWAISDSGTWWISAAGTGYNYVVSSTTSAISFKVIVPSAANATANGFPAGSVTTAGTTGMILPNGTKASFLFSTLDGTISGWNGKLGTANAICQIVINNSATGASYPGLAIYNTATASYILAANFGNNALEVYDGTFKKTSLSGSFTDPNLPSGYAPFSVHVLNGQIYVAYAMRTSSAPYRTVNAVGNGVVDEFDGNGNLVARIAAGGQLDSPWGVAIAPATFGIFGGDILIGNFGNGMINAYDPVHFTFQGQLTDGTGKPLTYASLWELLPAGTAVTNSTGVSGGTAGTVYFTAGLAGEQHGLLGAIANSTATGTPAFGISADTGTLTMSAGSDATTTIHIAPTYNFTGTVNFACSGLPPGATCSFSPAQLTAAGNAPSSVSLDIATHKLAGIPYHSPRGVAWALLLPFAGALALRRRRLGAARLVSACALALLSLGAVVGCESVYDPSKAPTPAGTSVVTVTASSGVATQSTTFSMVVQ